MFICIGICACAHTCAKACKCTYIFSMYMHTYMYTSPVYVYVSVYVYVCDTYNVFTYVYMHIYIYIRVRMCAVRAHVCTVPPKALDASLRVQRLCKVPKYGTCTVSINKIATTLRLQMAPTSSRLYTLGPKLGIVCILGAPEGYSHSSG